MPIMGDDKQLDNAVLHKYYQPHGQFPFIHYNVAGYGIQEDLAYINYNNIHPG